MNPPIFEVASQTPHPPLRPIERYRVSHGSVGPQTPPDGPTEALGGCGTLTLGEALKALPESLRVPLAIYIA